MSNLIATLDLPDGTPLRFRIADMPTDADVPGHRQALTDWLDAEPSRWTATWIADADGHDRLRWDADGRICSASKLFEDIYRSVHPDYPRGATNGFNGGLTWTLPDGRTLHAAAKA